MVHWIQKYGAYTFLLSSFCLFLWSMVTTLQPLPVLTTDASGIINAPHRTGELLIVFREENPEDRYENQFAKLEKIDRINDLDFYRATILPQDRLSEVLIKLQNDIGVRFVEPNYLLTVVPGLITAPLNVPNVNESELSELPNPLPLAWLGTKIWETDGILSNDFFFPLMYQQTLEQREQSVLSDSIREAISPSIGGTTLSQPEGYSLAEAISAGSELRKQVGEENQVLRVVGQDWRLDTASSIYSRWLREQAEENILFLLPSAEVSVSGRFSRSLLVQESDYTQHWRDLSALRTLRPAWNISMIQQQYGELLSTENGWLLMEALNAEFSSGGPSFELFGLPDSQTNQTSLRVNVQSERAVSYRFQVDDGPWTETPIPLEIPISFDGLLPGNHTLKVITGDSLDQWNDIGQAVVHHWQIIAGEPATITTLEGRAVNENAVDLFWFTPPSAQPNQPIVMYDLRYAEEPINLENWADAIRVGQDIQPGATGSSQSWQVQGLQDSQVYFFAIKSQDEVGNTSGISNVVELTTPLSQERRVLKSSEAAEIFLTESNVKRRIISRSALFSLGYRLEDVRTVPQSLLDTLETGEPLFQQLQPGELVQNDVTGEIFLITEELKRNLIPDLLSFARQGYQLEDLIAVDSQSLNQYELKLQ